MRHSVNQALLLYIIELNINHAASYHVSDYKQRRVILDHIKSLLASPDRSGLVASAADDYTEKDLFYEFITRWIL